MECFTSTLSDALGSVVNALAEIGKLCGKMKENQQPCVRVEKRLGEIFNQVRRRERSTRTTLSRRTPIYW